MSLVSRVKRDQAEEIRRKVKYYELAADPEFQTEFLKSIYLPTKTPTYTHSQENF